MFTGSRIISSAGNEVAGIYVGAHSRIPQPSGRNISSRPDYGDWSRLVFGVTGPQMDDEYLLKVTQVRTFFVPWISPSPHIHSGSLINLMCIQLQSGQNGAVCRRRIASHCPLRRQLEEPFLYDIHCIHSVYLYIVGRGRLKNPSACISITPCLAGPAAYRRPHGDWSSTCYACTGFDSTRQVLEHEAFIEG